MTVYKRLILLAVRTAAAAAVATAAARERKADFLLPVVEPSDFVR